MPWGSGKAQLHSDCQGEGTAPRSRERRTGKRERRVGLLDRSAPARGRQNGGAPGAGKRWSVRREGQAALAAHCLFYADCLASAPPHGCGAQAPPQRGERRAEPTARLLDVWVGGSDNESEKGWPRPDWRVGRMARHPPAESGAGPQPRPCVYLSSPETGTGRRKKEERASRKGEEAVRPRTRAAARRDIAGRRSGASAKPGKNAGAPRPAPRRAPGGGARKRAIGQVVRCER